MFLDPDPRQQKHSMSASPFLPPQTIGSTTESPATIKRKPLQQRSQSQNNRQSPARHAPKPTVRLVKELPPPSPPTFKDTLDALQKEIDTSAQYHERAQPQSPTPDKTAHETSASKPRFQDSSVSGSRTSTNEAQVLEFPDNITLLPKTSSHVVSKTSWHRRSRSSGNYSNSSTLKGSESAFAPSNWSQRLSSGTTLRGTPTPYEQEPRKPFETEQEPAIQGRAQALQTLEEASPEKSTIRAVPVSLGPASSEQGLGPGTLPSSSARPPSATSTSNSETAPVLADNISRGSSASSPSLRIPVRGIDGYHTPRHQQKKESLPPSNATLAQRWSSPNFIAYQSDSSRPSSRNQPLHYTASVESIHSVLQYPTVVRPTTGRSLTNSSSFASLQRSSSTDTLPPLRVPKKRLRHKPKSLSLGSQSNFASGKRMELEEVDVLPYPRQPFSSHLSTIASESDRSRNTSQHLSHFSLGSGVLTGDDASSIPLSSGNWPRGVREGTPFDSVATESSQPPPPSSSEEEAGDMTLGVFREASAMPQPLFKTRSPGAPSESQRYNSLHPPNPLVPSSADSEEDFDTVSALQSPALRPKHSGYSLRPRSSSTQNQGHSRGVSQVSYVDGERGSYGSSIFPTWARHFYGGQIALVSPSKMSLASQNTARPPQSQLHGRSDSQWTDRSITSRLEAGHSNVSTNSPASSHFLPSIFRPRTRTRGQPDGTRQPARLRRSKRSPPPVEQVSRPDSLAIFNDPLPQTEDANGDVLPSGQPKWGTLKNDTTAQLPPLPRKYSKQRHWDDMQFPRPMTKDNLTDFGIAIPRLHPSKRSPNRLSTWRAPSFVESLDTLVRSRCNRQILLFCLGFLCPLLWMLAAVLPLPKKPISATELEKHLGRGEEDVQAAMMKHEAGDVESRWREERQWMKARWWRMLNRIMSAIGVLEIGAVVAIAVVATR